MRLIASFVLMAVIAAAQGPREAAEVEQLEAQLAQLRKQYTEASPRVAELKARLAQLSAMAAKRRADAEKELSLKLQKPGALPAALPDTWWRNEAASKLLGLSEDQVKRMNDVFQQSRLKLIDQKAALDKEEAMLEPLVETETIDEGRAASQLDKVAQARAELEKTRGRMLLGIRKQLDSEQWRKLKENRSLVEKMTLR